MKRFLFFVFLCSFPLFFGCPESKVPLTPDPGPAPSEAVATPEKTISESDAELKRHVEKHFGSVEQDSHGRIRGVDLAGKRVSVDDTVLEPVLTQPGLKKLRVSGAQATPEMLAKIARQTELEELFLQDVSCNDQQITLILQSLPHLKRLTLRRMVNVLDEGLLSLRELRELRVLALLDMRITGKTMETIHFLPKLTALDLRGCSQLRLEDYLRLTEMPNLVDLKLGGFTIGDTALEKLATLPNLKGIALEDAMITREGFLKYLRTEGVAPRLESLTLARVPMLNDATLGELKSCSRLKSLTLRDVPVNGSFLSTLAESGIPLESLVVNKAFLKPEAFDALARFPKLKRLNLFEVYMDVDSIRSITKIPELEILELPECRLDDAMLEPLPDCRKLRVLGISGNPMVSEEAIRRLQSIPTLQTIERD